MNTFFKSKDPKTNYTEQNETSEDYINGIKCLEDLQKTNLSNIANTYFKMKENKKCIETCEALLVLDPRSVKALYWRGRAYAEEADYDEAIKDF
jgi:tetratricopeptide (TPR) repeat protein